MPRPDNDAPAAGWGRRGIERLELLAAIGSPQGEAFTARIKSLPPIEAAAEARWLFAETATEDLAASIANDLRLDPEVAAAIAADLAASRRRLAWAARPFPRQIVAKD